MPIYEAASIPMMSPSATNPPLTTTGSKVFNRCVFTDAPRVNLLLRIFTTNWASRIWQSCMMARPMARVLHRLLNDQFKGLGGTVVAFNAITPGESDYSAALADIASKKPQALFYGGYTAEAVVIVNQMKTGRSHGRHLLRR